MALVRAVVIMVMLVMVVVAIIMVVVMVVMVAVVALLGRCHVKFATNLDTMSLYAIIVIPTQVLLRFPLHELPSILT